MRKTIFDLLGRKGQTPVSMLTCYDYNTARTIDEAGVDMILVGDSLGNVMLGYENTLAVTVDDMIHHGKAVCRGAKEAFVVIDMPFMSYQPSVEEAVRNAGRIMKETGCHAVKLEGGREYADRIKAMQNLSAAGFKTWASIEPVIDFDSSFRMIQQALDAGCRHFKIGLMTRGTKVCRRGFTLGGKTFEPYDPARCLAFVQDVMQQTRDRATVYWKQSFRDFLRPVGSKRPKAERIGGTGKHRLFTDDELHKIFDDYPNAVGKEWSMFNPQNK